MQRQYVHSSGYLSSIEVFPPLMIFLCMSIQNCKETSNVSTFHLHISIVYFLQSSLARCHRLTIGSPILKTKGTQLHVVPVLTSVLFLAYLLRHLREVTRHQRTSALTLRDQTIAYSVAQTILLLTTPNWFPQYPSPPAKHPRPLTSISSVWITPSWPANQ